MNFVADPPTFRQIVPMTRAMRGERSSPGETADSRNSEVVVRHHPGVSPQLRCDVENDARLARLHPGRQSYDPTPSGVVHLQFDDCLARRMVNGQFDEQEIRPHLRDAEPRSVHQQLHPDQGGMATAGTQDIHGA